MQLDLSAEDIAFRAELRRWLGANLYNIGPVLLQAGTPEQQERYLPKMVTAEEIW